MTRDQLKTIIREIFLELLSEGFGSMSKIQSSTQRSFMPEQTVNGRRRPKFDSRLDTPIDKSRIPTNALKEAIKLEANGNSVLADIFADTAVTTLASQLAQGDQLGVPGVGTATISRNSAPTQQEQFAGSPDEIFGDGGRLREDGSSHWADLAFMSNKKLL